MTKPEERGSRDTGSDEPSGGPVDRPSGTYKGDESVPAYDDGGKPERCVPQLEIGERKLAKIGNVGGQTDQLQKRDAGKQARRGDHDGYCRDEQHPCVGGEIPEMTGIGMMGLHGGGFLAAAGSRICGTAEAASRVVGGYVS